MRTMLVAVALAVSLAAAAPATATAPPGVSVHGAGWVTYPGIATELAVVGARVLPSGEPHGTIANVSPLGVNVATVTCMEVVGDTVYVGGRLRPGLDVYDGETFSQLAFGVRDGGGDGDLVAAAIFRRADVDPCARLSGFPPIFPVERGNFVVRGL